MAKKKSSKASTPKKNKDTATGNDSSTAPAEDLPPDIAAYKAKLEAETGKKYRYRPKDETQTIGYMLKYGTGDNVPQTWLESLKWPAAFAIMFVLSFFAFLKLVPPEMMANAPQFHLPKGQKPLLARFAKEGRMQGSEHGGASVNQVPPPQTDQEL